jgi:2-polyprenyl-3-methyl-5-hydroxy-6-metoxy-1,4-benzoquinol methylase
MNCRICGGNMQFRWTLPVFHNRYLASYHECVSCHSLQIENPTWLEESYREIHTPEYQALEGRASIQRSEIVRDWIHSIGFTKGKVLDFGGGPGHLKRMLESQGFQVDIYDPYYANSALGSDYDLIVCSDVVEHLIYPNAAAQLFNFVSKGWVLVKTPLYVSGLHKEDWWLLAREYGQHVTMWSENALRLFRERNGLKLLWLPF